MVDSLVAAHMGSFSYHLLCFAAMLVHLFFFLDHPRPRDDGLSALVRL